METMQAVQYTASKGGNLSKVSGIRVNDDVVATFWTFGATWFAAVGQRGSAEVATMSSGSFSALLLWADSIIRK